MVRTAVCCCMMLAIPCHAAELFSVSAQFGPPVTCADSDQWFSALANAPGAGRYPTAPSTIVGVDVWTDFASRGSYLVIGQTPPNGDWITPRLSGRGERSMFYPSGSGFRFDPHTDELHVHYHCPPSDGSDSFGFTIFYTVP